MGALSSPGIRQLLAAATLAALLGMPLLSGPCAQAAEIHRYIERIGSSMVPVRWSLERLDNAYRLSTITPQQVNITITNDRFETLRWSKEHPAEGTRLVTDRRGDRLFIDGTFRGKRIQNSLSIAAGPWYQATSLSLRRLALGEASQETFTTLRPDTLDTYRLRAEKASAETLVIAGEKTPALKIRLKLAGIPAFLYESCYWFRKADGLLLRFEGPGGAPGTPEISLEYVGEGEG